MSAEAKRKQEVLKEQWESHFCTYGRGVHMFRTTELSKLLLQGVPDMLRREIWMIFSGISINCNFRMVHIAENFY